MSFANGTRNVAWASALLLVAATAHSDGGCAKGYRDISDGERGAMSAVLETAKKAIPAPPAGWVIRGDDTVSLPTTSASTKKRGPGPTSSCVTINAWTTRKRETEYSRRRRPT